MSFVERLLNTEAPWLRDFAVRVTWAPLRTAKLVTSAKFIDEPIWRVVPDIDQLSR
jgi:hypothetical protein